MPRGNVTQFMHTMAAVLAPITDTLASLTLGGGSVTYSTNVRAKALLDEAEKQKRIFETSYEPSLEWWTADQAAYVKPTNDPLPDGFPERVDNASVWNGRDLINQPDKWLYTFTPEDIAALDAAHAHFVKLNVGLNDITRETFPIRGSLLNALSDARDSINGIGFRVLRGLPVDDWSRQKQIAIFAGVSAYIGDRRIKQGTQNIVHLRDITNLDVDKRPAITVKGQTSGNQVYHNDGFVDIVGLITLGVAEEGGLSQLSSVGQTYNHLAATRRDLVRELAKGDWKTKVFPNGKPQIFALDNGVISSYSRRPFFGFYEADADVPPLSTTKHLALDAIHFTAEHFGLDLALQKGDLEFFNNHTVFHARTSSADSEKNARHLIRVHLRNLAQELPEGQAEVWAKLQEGEATEWPEEAWSSVDPHVGLKSVDV